MAKKQNLFFFSFLVMSFQANSFRAASKDFFEGHQLDSEALVLGGISKARNEGYFSNWQYSLLGAYNWGSKDWVAHQYDLYLNNLEPNSQFNSYTSSFGLQGHFYTFVDNSLLFLGIESGRGRLYLSRLLTSAALAVLLTFFIYFVQQRYGMFSAILTFALIAISQWIVVFANNLYWMFFLIFFPFISVTGFLQSRCAFTRNFRFLYLFVFLAILIKSLAGYEYISTILISTVTPLVFFAIMDNYGLKIFLKRFLYLGISGLSGFFTAISIHLLQLVNMSGSFSNAINSISDIVSKRTHGNPDKVDEIYRSSLESSIFDVIKFYLDGNTFNLNSLLGFNRSVQFLDCIIVLVAVTLIGFVLTANIKSFQQFQKINIATSLMLWFSITAPLSWYILAKGHSYIHTHMNHVLWYIPFLLIGFAYSGFVCSLVIKLIQSSSNRQ